MTSTPIHRGGNSRPWEHRPSDHRAGMRRHWHGPIEPMPEPGRDIFETLFAKLLRRAK